MGIKLPVEANIGSLIPDVDYMYEKKSCVIKGRDSFVNYIAHREIDKHPFQYNFHTNEVYMPIWIIIEKRENRSKINFE